MNPRIAISLIGLTLLGCGDKRDPGQWPVSRAQLAADGGAGAAASAALDDDGAALTYRRYCVGCHGDDGRGNDGSTGADFTAKDSPLTKSDAALLASVRDGKLGKRATMPPHKPVLKDAQIAAVIAYVRQRFGAH